MPGGVPAIIDDDVEFADFGFYVAKEVPVGLAADENLGGVSRVDQPGAFRVDVNAIDQCRLAKIFPPHAHRAAPKDADFKNPDWTIPIGRQKLFVDTEIVMPLLDILALVQQKDFIERFLPPVFEEHGNREST